MNKRVLAVICTMAITSLGFEAKAFADNYSSNQILKLGMKNQEVLNIQKDLKGLGYFKGDATGYFGSYTKDMVAKYQKDNGINADGVVWHSTAMEIKADEILKTAKQCVGIPYVWAGTTTKGFDCSGFTQYVMKKSDITLQRTASQQYKQGTWVAIKNLKAGDLVFFSTYMRGASHVGIYLGDNKFIHASSGAKKITISNLTSKYFKSRYLGAKRFVK